MLQIPKIDFQPYLDLLWRRKWWVVFPLLLTLVAGGVYVYISPRMYRASTLILVEAQRVPNSYVQSTVTESLQSRLQTISQQVNSRTNLEKIIKEFELQPPGDKEKSRLTRLKEKIRDKVTELLGREDSGKADQEEGPSMQALVKKVRGKVDISLKSGNQAFEISFEWRDPGVAARVANALASQFIEQNLAVREEMAMGTTSFLAGEVKRLRQELETKEKKLEEFKGRHMGMLPGQLQSNLNILSQLKEELNNLETRVAQEKQQKVMLRNQMAMQEDLFASGPELSGEEETPERIARLQDELDSLRSSYTENHPDVRRLKRQIEHLKQAEKEEEGNATAAGFEAPELQEPEAGNMFKPQLEQIERRVAEYEEKIEELKEQIKVYKKRVEKTSEVELQLKNLQRGYESVRDRYKNLLGKKLNAEMSEEMEKRQKGEQFRVIDPAVTPARPFTPDVTRAMLMALILGLGLGGGLAYVREVLDPAFYTPEEVENSLGVDVLVSLPFAEKEKEKGMSNDE